MERSWKAIDWEAERPSPQEITASKQRLEFAPTDVTSPAVLGLVDTFRSLFRDGGAHVASFQVSGADDAAHWFFSRNRFDEYGFIAELLTSNALATALPDLAPVAPDLGEATFNPDLNEAAFTESSPLLLDGQIAGALVWGGPYKSFDGSMADAKRVGITVCNELIGERFEDFRIDISQEPWSKWFKATAWDGSWILTDLRDKRVTLICITDTD